MKNGTHKQKIMWQNAGVFSLLPIYFDSFYRDKSLNDSERAIVIDFSTKIAEYKSRWDPKTLSLNEVLNEETLEFSENESKRFFSTLAENSRFEEVRFYSIKLNNDGTRAFEEGLKRNTTLKSIAVNDDLNERLVWSVVKGLRKNQTLERLDIQISSCNLYCKDFFKDLADLLKENHTLIDFGLSFIETSFEISDAHLEGVQILVDVIKEKDTLLELRICCPNLHFIQNLIDAVKVHKGLQLVTFEVSQSLSLEIMQSLAEMLEANSILSSFGLFYCTLNDECIQILADVLSISKLKNLSLYANEISPTGATILSDVLATNQILQRLGLAWNHIGNIGIQALFSALRNNTCLECLDIHENNIDDGVLKCFKETFMINDTLGTLNIGNNYISDEGLSDLEEVVRENETLCYLEYHGFDRRSAHCDEMEKHLEQNHSSVFRKNRFTFLGFMYQHGNNSLPLDRNIFRIIDQMACISKDYIEDYKKFRVLP